MDMELVLSVFFSLMALLCAMLVVYGGWLCLSEAARSNKNDRRSGPQTAASPGQPLTDAVYAAGRVSAQG